jgi:hypothetical protein
MSSCCSTHRREKTTKNNRSQNLFATVLLAALAFTTTIARAAGPLPSWGYLGNSDAFDTAIAAFAKA